MRSSVSSTIPANSAIDVSVESVRTVKFSEGVNALTINTFTFSVDNKASGTVGFDLNNTKATFTPAADLNYNDSYTVTITTEVEDLTGEHNQTDYLFSI